MRENTVIYVVMGQRGEYSDHTEWAVAAYLERALADKHADTAMILSRSTAEKADAIPTIIGINGKGDYFNTEATNKVVKESGIYAWDKDWSVSWLNIADYFVLEVPLRMALPEAPNE